jgi:hypothetical protein
MASSSSSRKIAISPIAVRFVEMLLLLLMFISIQYRPCRGGRWVSEVVVLRSDLTFLFVDQY